MKTNEPTTLETLHAVQAKCAEMSHEIQKRIDFLAGEIDNVTGQIVDSPDENERKDLRYRRANFVTELDCARAEVKECCRRFEFARQAVHEYRLAIAQKVYDAADIDSRAKRQVLLKLQNDKLHFMNRGGRSSETAKSIAERLKIDIAIAQAESELLLANRLTKSAGAELAQIRSECEPPAVETPAKLQVTPLHPARSWRG